MSEYLSTTLSTCRVCRRLIPARVEAESDGVWFRKICPEHGAQQARVYGDAALYRQLARFHRPASMPGLFSARTLKGCPRDCGFCPDHEQHLCLPIIEITDHCDLGCPVCLVKNRSSFHRTPEEVARMLDVIIQSEGQIDVLNLSGGEPALNPFFRQIVEECASRKEILRVSISTNGLMLSRDAELMSFLADRGAIVSLQFDGFDDQVYKTLRGGSLLETKLRLIEQCAQSNVPMSLTATVAQGINEQQLRQIVDFFFQQDHILSLMFQPLACLGNAAARLHPAQTVTIPDVIEDLAGAGHGTVKPSDFSPLPCCHPACFSLAFYLKVEEKKYLSVKPIVSADRYLNMIQNRAIFGTDADSFAQITDAVYELWSSPAAHAPDSQRVLSAVKRLIRLVTDNDGYSPARAFAVAERSVKSIFIHHFMDLDTFDLARARKCCQAYPQPDGRLMPACVYNCLMR
jgi:uncharacterized radical SAM superfamily Fe-S cluster-containing enzyme